MLQEDMKLDKNAIMRWEPVKPGPTLNAPVVERHATADSSKFPELGKETCALDLHGMDLPAR